MEKNNIYIGCSGWYYKEWREVFYPAHVLANKFFSYYVNYFKTVEINSTFYNFPQIKTVQRWHNQAPKDFKYSIKANRCITHLKRFKGVLESLKRLYDLSDALKEKTGCFLFQLPPSFSFKEERLQRIISQLDNKHQNVVEFRHPSWWNREVIHVLSANNIIFCSVSGMNLPENLIFTNKKAYLRFHGDPSYSTNYSYKDLLRWAQLIKDNSPQEAWIYFNNTRNVHAVQNALDLAEFCQAPEK